MSTHASTSMAARPGPAVTPTAGKPDRDLTALCTRLDEISRQVGRLVFHVAGDRTGPDVASETEGDALDRAVAEIAERQRLLAGTEPAVPSMFPPPPAAPPEPNAAASSLAAPAPAPSAPAASAPDLSGLEQQLKFLTTQIEILRAPSRADEFVGELRGELANIARMIENLVPRSAFDALESEVRSLAARLDVNRSAVSDAAAFAPLEQGLGEIRDALRGLAPVELESAVRTLSHKIDQITASGADPETFRQLDAAISALHGIVAQVASGDPLAALVKEVRALGDKIEQSAVAERREAASAAERELLLGLEKQISGLADAMHVQRAPVDVAAIEPMIESIAKKLDGFDLVAHDEAAIAPLKQQIGELGEKIERFQPGADPAALAPLEQRIDHLADTIERLQPPADPAALAPLEQRIDHLAGTIERINTPAPWPALEPLEERIRALAEKLDRLEENPPVRGDIGPLEHRIEQLSEKLVASEARLGALQTIERGMADLLAHLDEMRRARAEGKSAEQPHAARAPAEDAAAADDHPRLGPNEVADPPPPPIASPGAPLPPRPADSSLPGNERRIPAASFLTTEPAAARAVAPASGATEAPVVPPPALSPANPGDAGQAELAPDAPIEPGAGPPRNLGGRSAAERIASSMAALGASPHKATPPTSSLPNFIVAARRAAQAASEQQSQTAAAALADAAPSAIRQKLAQRVKSLFVSASVIMVGFGVAGIALSSADLLNFANGRSTQRSATIADIGPRNGAVPPARRPAEEAAPGLALPKPFSAATPLPERPGHGDADTPPLAASPANHGANATTPAAPPAKPEPPSTKTANADHTGSIPPLREDMSAPGARPSAARTPHSNPIWSDPIPAGFATKPLLDGIAAGNPAAAFEIASRYAEGRGAPADLSAAAIWFARAAEAGLAPAQFRLGSMYEKGLGVKKDLAEARRLYLAAAAKGNASAMHNVAVLYAEGIDGKPDFAGAAEWFRKASEYGVADSQYNLAILYARGIGVEQNLAEAFKWFAIAGQKGDKDAAKKSDDIGGRLAQPLLAAARTAASVFAPKLQPEEATAVPAPPGGWDDAAAAPAKPKPRARHQSQQSARL